MKKTIFWVLLAVLFGSLLGKATFDKYEDVKLDTVISYNDKMYALKYGTYKSFDDMKKALKNIERYIYIKTNDDINVYLAIAEKEVNIKKIKKIYDNKKINTSIEKVNIDNDEFIQNVNEYEKLLDATEESSSLIIIENQILSCYEKLVVNDEE